MNANRNSGGERPEDTRNARLAILIDAPDHTADVRDLHAVALPCDRPDHIGVRHEIVHVALMHKGVTECQHLFAVHRRHRSRRADAEVAVDNGDPNGLTARKSGIIARGKGRIGTDRSQRKEGTACGHIVL